MDFRQVQVAAESRDEALRLAWPAVEGRLAACAQVVGPITSVYRWEGVVEEAEKWRVSFETAGQKYAALGDFVKSTHSYWVDRQV